MKNSFLVFPCLVAAVGCNFGAGPSVVYYPPPSKTTTVVIEDAPPGNKNVSLSSTDEYVVVEERVIVEEEVVYAACDPYLEVYEAPFYHQPAFCTDYGIGTGYCCTWEYIDDFGALCSHESCFWEDVCEWEPVIDECTFDGYY